MKSEFISRTFTTSKTTLSAPGKKPMEVDTMDVSAVVAVYAAANEIDPKSVKVMTKEEKTLYKMSVEDFLKNAEPVKKNDTEII